MSITFPFRKEQSSILGAIRRPIADTLIKHKKQNIWRPVTMIVDTGADYTLLPQYLASFLGVYFTRDCREIEAQGVGRKSKIYLLKDKLQVKIGEFERRIPVGFLPTNSIPPLLGRQEFFETFRVIFEKFNTKFEE